MARAKSFPEPDRQIAELVKAANSVTIGVAPEDLDEDGTPKHDTRAEQMDGRYIRFVSKGPGVEVEVRHSLGRTPTGLFETARAYPAPMVGVPNDQSINRSWTKDRVFLVPQSPAGTKHRVLLL